MQHLIQNKEDFILNSGVFIQYINGISYVYDLKDLQKYKI